MIPCCSHYLGTISLTLWQMYMSLNFGSKIWGTCMTVKVLPYSNIPFFPSKFFWRLFRNAVQTKLQGDESFRIFVLMKRGGVKGVWYTAGETSSSPVLGGTRSKSEKKFVVLFFKLQWSNYLLGWLLKCLLSSRPYNDKFLGQSSKYVTGAMVINDFSKNWAFIVHL